MKTAFLFSGQGDQYPGMGKDLYDQYEIVQKTFEQASNVLNYDMAELCFTENEQLDLTEYTQPAILTVSVAFLRLLKEKGIQPDAAAGLSLGEYSALVASQALSFETAVDLVARRGKYMAEAAPSGVGKMVAVMNMPADTIEKACQQASEYGIISPANYNTPKQIVIGGEEKAVDYALDLLSQAGARRMIPLNVSGPFHTKLLEPASKQLKEVLKETTFNEMQIPVVSNTTAKVMKQDEIKHLLELQVKSPVRFYESVATLKELGIERIIEVGPGKTINGFMKKIDKSIKTDRISDLKTLQATEETI
ncbi:ACP S-malonyltransferase [Tetragenococcus halophilus]|uniref:Malonyl CoA-acyl carrier protein transacylase n=1 Tax=Tetragenococcus halophilus (strain DSM 20338 / JCM 20259 / NCIMB 9735 / NBRC 12172) TaxID=945021 RepID=A0AAN1SHP7_TETHN|nr:ACP S-malonyltransferase [Tetragenococcus halophilus]NWO01072.1 ACP S-malonyltransferase [Tetragenococcus halophilus]QXN87515.1 ACP S-malonyltransferase [Tetragenococcus halophilus]RQD33201.1 [acyl-carrier-protein] S-malonyltransferase [Tetragenococcus halophilus subsp. halophilus DSM 20339]WJS82689.1 ACP S-malonyltransferase [Tetragenococcus halophilus]BAK95259.1 malonyl-CoA--acyl carrier protein transacylase [Tetragenococcus halophilus NBRC 12172]